MNLLTRIVSSFWPGQAERVEVQHVNEDAQMEPASCPCGAPASKQIDASPMGPTRRYVCGICGAPARVQ